MNDTDWPTYLAALSTNQSAIARVAGVSTATVSRWFSRSTQPLAPQVIAVARAYEQSPVVALVAAGYLTREEVEREVALTPGMSLAEFSELDLAQELVRRLEAGETTGVSEAPLDVDHPAWAPNDVGGSPEDDFYNLDRWGYPHVAIRIDHHTEPPTFLDPEGGRHQTLAAAVEWISERLLGDVGELEQMKHAAKTRAREIEEDQHTP